MPSPSYRNHLKPSSRRSAGRLATSLIVLSSLAVLLLALVAYMLWPRWPTPAALDAPALPIVVGGELFNVPPAAIRVPVQRRPGTQERVDLAFQWPSLAPPDPAAKLAGDRLFVTIAVAAVTISPAERVATIYPRYTASDAAAGPDGLMEYAFRDGSPYQGEDLFVDRTAPQNFAVRCSRRTTPRTPGICLFDRRIGGADMSVRFQRDWLDEWRTLASAIDRVIATLRPPGEPTAR